MEHWFDGFTKALGSYNPSNPSRRGMLATLAMAASASFGAGNGLARVATATPAPRPAKPGAAPKAPAATSKSAAKTAAPPRPGPRVTKVGPCTITQTGTSVTVQSQMTTSSGGKSVTITETRYTAQGVNSYQAKIEVAGTPQLQLSHSKPTFSMTPGPGFGLGAATFTSQDGKTLTGSIAGRAIVPFDMSAVVSGSQVDVTKLITALRFADGKPAPAVNADATVLQAIKDAFAYAARNANLCVATPAPVHRPEFKKHTAAYDATPAQTDYTASLPACTSCYANCNSQLHSCLVQAALGAAACGPFYAACLGGIIDATCLGPQNACNTNCQLGDCQPVACGLQGCLSADVCALPSYSLCCPGGSTVCAGDEGLGMAFCCDSGDTCISAAPFVYYTCCPQGQAVCNGQTCCAPGQQCSNEGICCVAPQGGAAPVSCNGNCCAPGLVCAAGGICCDAKDICGGTCCTGGTCLNGKCCAGTSQSKFGPPSEILCGETCCPALGGTCCNDKCCEGICLKGVCCPEPQVCGTVCCAPGQNCTGGRCVSVGCGRDQHSCASPMNSGPPKTICCPTADTTCCNGQCCPNGEVCCVSNTGQFGCNPSNRCEQLQ
jgi:hypothetical protein